MGDKAKWRLRERASWGFGVEFGQKWIWDEPTGWWVEVHLGRWTLGRH